MDIGKLYKLISVKETQSMLGVSRSTLMRWLEQRIPDFPRPFKIGRQLKWNYFELERYVQSKRAKHG